MHPIWQDESMEYYCSIPVKGAIQGVTQYTTMYERMAYIQQQPPLYNWLMCIWLQIHDSEWWYRFSSVVMGFIAVIGLYLVIRTVWQIFSYLVCFCVFQYLYSDVLCERSIRIYAFNHAVDLDCISIHVYIRTDYD